MNIYVLRSDPVLWFAAEELKKYLRMMMPDAGDFAIAEKADAKGGFRLGLLEDFGIKSEAEDPVLDDVIHVDTQADGGVLAGSNSRSVLFAVYRFLRENGCRWLYPGVDGDYVPMQDVQPTKYHKLADHRFRGFCNEGAESQQCMLDTIDHCAKLELNVYMMEFNIPFTYYNKYYSHKNNEVNRPPEPVSLDQVLQWKRQCETEIAKRGLQFHDMGHGWTAEPFGISSAKGWSANLELQLTDEQKECVALLNGERKLYKGVALNTNLCMSNPKVRTTMVKGIVDYAEKHQNVDYLHVWLADGSRNHCECENCQKARPSDFYLMIMNELDEALTAKKLDTRIVFIAYVDTIFAPEQVTIRNPKRFSLLYAPITRSYTSSVKEGDEIPAPIPYVRNAWKRPRSSMENLALLREWQKTWKGPSFCYEYHFWRPQYADPGHQYLARRIYEDIRGLRFMKTDGIVEDGSQRSFFPNGFLVYIYAETLMNRDCDYEAVQEDYYSHIYGAEWKTARALLQRMSDAFDFGYMYGEKSENPEIGDYYRPSHAEQLKQVAAIAAEEKAFAEAHLAMEDRPKTVSMRLLRRHADFCAGLAPVIAIKAQGDDEKAGEAFKAFLDDFGKYEVEIERYYDQGLAGNCLRKIIRPKVQKSYVEGL